MKLQIRAGKTPIQKELNCRPNDNLTSNECLLFTPFKQPGGVRRRCPARKKRYRDADHFSATSFKSRKSAADSARHAGKGIWHLAGPVVG